MAHAPRHRIDWRRWFSRRAKVLVLACGSGLLLPLFSHVLADNDGRVPWLIDLAAHWQWLFLPGLMIAALFATVSDSRWWCCAMLLVPLPWLTAASAIKHASDAAVDLSIATANVHFTSTDVGPLAAWLAREKPDVVVVLEVSSAYARELRDVPDYRYQRVAASEDPFGIALLSRYPLTDDEVQRDEHDLARIEAKLQLPTACVTVIAVHPMPPLSPLFHRARNTRLHTLAVESASRAQPTVIAGDLNATPWSSAFSGLADLGLQRASDLRPSWPSFGQGVIGIPIDHVLVSNHWSVVSSTRGVGIASDHLPLVVRLHLNTRSNAIEATPQKCR
ncbi:MAG: endonuclease/exonuclease/phosphatase family protein [Pseudomarimonas sp.]